MRPSTVISQPITIHGIVIGAGSWTGFRYCHGTRPMPCDLESLSDVCQHCHQCHSPFVLKAPSKHMPVADLGDSFKKATPSTSFSCLRTVKHGPAYIVVSCTPAPYGHACVNCTQSKCKCITRQADRPCERSATRPKSYL